MIEELILSFNSIISSRICAWIVTSRAVVGSSAIITFGLHASAMAIITRWRMPPDNSCGNIVYTPSLLAMPTISKSSIVRALTSSGLLPSPSCNSMTSSTCLPIRKTGFKLVIGSWKIIDT